jgi:hypothetical protein
MEDGQWLMDDLAQGARVVGQTIFDVSKVAEGLGIVPQRR